MRGRVGPNAHADSAQVAKQEFAADLRQPNGGSVAGRGACRGVLGARGGD